MGFVLAFIAVVILDLFMNSFYMKLYFLLSTKILLANRT